MPTRPVFLRPSANGYALDAVCNELVLALEARHFKVPGIEVEFRVYGSGEQRMRHVSKVSGDDFEIHYGRQQGTLEGGHWSESAAASEVTIPRKKISVYSDFSGPSFYLYVGADWHRDRPNFAGVLSKHYGKPRTYLCYTGSEESSRRCSRNRRSASPFLVHTNDLGREYDPIDEPEYFETSEVMREFDAYLREHALAKVLEQPAEPEPFEFSEPSRIPWPTNLPPSVYCYATHRACTRIRQGQHDPSQLDAAKRYALSGNGWRLCSLDIPNDGTFPQAAYKGFLWCAFESAEGVPREGADGFGDNNPVLVQPTYANDVYVADYAAALDRTLPYVEGRQAVARTLVAVEDYKGGYAMPIVLIARELGFDEVTLVKRSAEQS